MALPFARYWDSKQRITSTRTGSGEHEESLEEEEDLQKTVKQHTPVSIL
jgi:hypothetical protein